MMIVPYSDFEPVLEIANSSPYGLQASVYTSNLSIAHQAVERLQFGSVLINQMPSFRLDPLPYGGIKASGNTKEGVYSAYRALTWEKCVVMNPFLWSDETLKPFFTIFLWYLQAFLSFL